jgi:hypothetical protein
MKIKSTIKVMFLGLALSSFSAVSYGSTEDAEARDAVWTEVTSRFEHPGIRLLEEMKQDISNKAGVFGDDQYMTRPDGSRIRSGSITNVVGWVSEISNRIDTIRNTCETLDALKDGLFAYGKELATLRDGTIKPDMTRRSLTTLTGPMYDRMFRVVSFLLDDFQSVKN